MPSSTLCKFSRIGKTGFDLDDGYHRSQLQVSFSEEEMSDTGKIALTSALSNEAFVQMVYGQFLVIDVRREGTRTIDLPVVFQSLTA